MRKPKKLALNIPIETLLNAHKNYSNLYKMASDYNTTRHTLINTFDYFNIEAPLSKKLSKSNYNFFQEINEKSMYWSGVIAADGNIRKSSSKSSALLKIKLQRSDKNHLEKFKLDIESDKKIYDYNDDASNPSSTLMISSNKMCEDLLKFGITPNKTKTFIIPKEIIEHPLFNHFIRGFMDGDGCFYYKESSNSFRTHLLGVSMATEQIYNFIKNKLSIDFPLYSYYSEYGTKTWKWSISKIIDNIKLIEYLYSGATTYMQRKYDKSQLVYEAQENSNIYYFNPDELQNQYNQLQSFKEVAKLYNCSPCTIRYNMKKFKLETKSPTGSGRKKKLLFSDDELIESFNELKSVSSLSKKYKCSIATISTKLMILGIEVRRESKYRIA